ncbi:MAG: hypothetical protein JSV96_09615 [Candidatus Aminicenantes bacterium]|nr:MAG: hypothetical protein JSV96_09615 [Candidatus Aminicenantes bacterium]
MKKVIPYVRSWMMWLWMKVEVVERRATKMDVADFPELFKNFPTRSL